MNPILVDGLHLVPAGNGMVSKDDPGEPGRGLPRWSINEQEGQILAELVKGYEVFEIGTGLGISTMWLYSTAKIVYTHDIDSWVQLNVFPILPDAIIKLKEFPTITSEHVRKFDCIFIDGFHKYESALTDIERSRPILKKGGLFIFHDFNIPGVKNAIMDSTLKFVEIKTFAGMAIAWNE